MKRRILVINFGGIGDQIMFFPTLETIKKLYDNPFITLVTESRSRSVSELTDLVDEVFICDLKEKNRFFELFKLLLKAYTGKYDAVISSGASKVIPIILFSTGIKDRTGYDNGCLSRILLTKAVKLNKNQYAANMYHDLVEEAKEVKIPAICHLITNTGTTQTPHQVRGDREKKTIVIHPGASKLSIKKGIYKCWTTENWIKLIEKLISTGDYNVVLTGGPDDAEVMEKLTEKFPDNIAQTRSLKDFVNIVANSDILVCVDSAPMHIGVGLRKRVIALFGPTDEKKLLPEHELFTAVKNNDLNCRPCLWDKRNSNCETSDCLNISSDYIFEIISGAGVTGDFDSVKASDNIALA